MGMTVIFIVIGVFRTTHKSLQKRLDELEIRKRIETMKITALLKLVEYSEESWRSRRLAVTQTPVKDCQLKLV